MTNTETTVFDGAIIQVVTKPVDNIPAFEVVKHPGAVAIVAHDNSSVYVTSQWRPAVEQYVIELCAGTCELGEDPLHTAKRELAEELGFEASNWNLLASFFSSPGYTDEKVMLWRAWDLTMVDKPEADDSGKIEIIQWPLDEIETLIDTSQSAKTIIGLSMLKESLDRL